MMNGPQKSDCCEVAMSPANEIEGSIEESEERRRQAEGTRAMPTRAGRRAG